MAEKHIHEYDNGDPRLCPVGRCWWNGGCDPNALRAYVMAPEYEIDA